MSEGEFYSRTGDDSRREYLGGAAVVREPASDGHEDLFAFLLALLRTYLEERGEGLVRGSRFPMRLDESWSPEPDLMVIREARRHRLGPRRLEGPADLVIEIASDSAPRADLRLKLPRYRQAAVPEIWLIDPRTRSVRVETLADTGYRTVTMPAGRLDATAVPGFWIDVEWLWREPLPPVLSCLHQILA
jgi:Uma2 family endonuclease